MKRNLLLVGQTVDVLVERDSAKSNLDWMGRTDTNKTVVFPKTDEAVGDCVSVAISRCNTATLFGARPAGEYRRAVNQ
jgi:tRNA-2-methylthio-N6-dimethylallyladenosine synthase